MGKVEKTARNLLLWADQRHCGNWDAIYEDIKNRAVPETIESVLRSP